MRRFVILFLLFPVFFPFLIGSAIASDSSEHAFAKKRGEMIERDIKSRGIKDPRVLAAMGKVKRHLFVDPWMSDKAYEDYPLPIGDGQTISQPYIVALMTEALALKGDERVLEIGTGSGYQAAVLAEIAKEVYTIEIKKGLAERADNLLKGLGYRNIHVRYGDGFAGWEAHAPFDAIIITAAASRIPPPLLAQLREGGKLIMPLGSTFLYQNLTLVVKGKGKHTIKELGAVRFVPLTGEVQRE
jgi:protein-L-isoaspartate(D-aspartate) O-methyltransferase